MQTQMKIALAGGGGANDSRLLDEAFAAWIGPEGKLLYWPLALRGVRPFQSCLEWITAAFAPWGVTRISMWTDLSEHRAGELDEFDAVYIGGGNTFALLAQLRESGFDRHLKAYARRGKAVRIDENKVITFRLLDTDIPGDRGIDRNLCRYEANRPLFNHQILFIQSNHQNLKNTIKGRLTKQRSKGSINNWGVEGRNNY